MTATIIAFPCAFERMDIEFTRTGANELTRAFDDAPCLFASMVAADPLPFDYAERLGSFEASVEHLTRIRPEAIDDYVILDDRDWLISLSAMPALLRAMGATRSA